MKMKKLIVLLIVLAVVSVNLLQITETIYAEAYEDSYYRELSGYINNTKGGISIEVKNNSETYIYKLENYSQGLEFQIHSKNSKKDRTEGILTIILDDQMKFFSVKFSMNKFVNNISKDSVTTTTRINKKTYTQKNVYKVHKSGDAGYLNSDVISEEFNKHLNLLTSFLDKFLSDNLDFGLNALGFECFDNYEKEICISHIYSNDCDSTCNICGTQRSIQHKYTEYCDVICDICGNITYTWRKHTYSNDMDDICNICEYKRIIIDVDNSSTIDYGRCGNNLNWKFTKNGTLVISGTGDMDDYGKLDPPWYKYRSEANCIQILDGVTNIGEHAFENFINVKNVFISESVKKIGKYCFRNCKNLININIPVEVNVLPAYAFSNCRSLEYIDILSYVEVGNYCFENCVSLKSFDATRYVGEGAFINCEKLETLRIGADYVMLYALEGCYSLREIYSGNFYKSKIYDLDKIYNENSGLYYAKIITNTKKTSKIATLTSDNSLENSHDCNSCLESEDFEEVVSNANNEDYSEGKNDNIILQEDINSDREINNKDVEYLLWHTLFPKKYPIEGLSDLNSDREINNKDVEYLLWHILFPEKYLLELSMNTLGGVK